MKRFQHWRLRDRVKHRDGTFVGTFVRCDYIFIPIFVRRVSVGEYVIPNFSEWRKRHYRSLGAATRAVNRYRPLDRCYCTTKEIMEYEFYLAQQHDQKR